MRRIQVRGRLLQLPQAIVGAAIQVQYVHMVPQQLDGRQEPIALQAVLVEILGWRIGGCDQRHAPAAQSLEQAGEDHRIGNVGNEEFVQAKYSRVLRKALRDAVQRGGAAATL